MAIDVTRTVKTTVENVFYVKEDTNSPYQGRIVLTQEEYAALNPGDMEALELAQYTAWKEGVATAQAAAEAAALLVPQTITMSSARRIVFNMGLKDTVEALVNQAGPDAVALWYTSDTLQRQHPILLQLSALIPLSSDQLDDMFRQGDPA